jgi:hypothetical protein
MARPTTIEDVDEYLKAPHTFITVDLQFLTRDIAVGAAVLNLINEARRSVEFSFSEDGEFKVTVPRSDAELAAALRSAQRSWDHGEELHAKVVDGGDIETWQRGAVNRWLKAEGREPIDWDRIDAEAVLS